MRVDPPPKTDRSLLVTRPIAFKWTDPVAGERYRPLEITPRVSVRPDSPVLMFPERDRNPRKGP